jgi:hypothetical protein
MTKKNALNVIFFTVIIMSMVFAFGLRANAHDGYWSWRYGEVEVEAIAWNEPGGGVTVSLYAENDNDYDIRFDRFRWTVYIGGRSYEGRISVGSVEAGEREWLGDIHAEWRGREKVSSVSIPGTIRMERID